MYCICSLFKARGDRQGVYLALHVLGLFSGHICGCLEVQHGLALLLLILLLVSHLEQPPQIQCQCMCITSQFPIVKITGSVRIKTALKKSVLPLCHNDNVSKQIHIWIYTSLTTGFYIVWARMEAYRCLDGRENT